MLCTVFHLQGIVAPYKKCYENHPCTKWCRESKANFVWATNLLLHLLVEYTKRYGKTHKSQEVYYWILDNLHLLKFDKEELTPFAQAMPDEYKNEDAVLAYRKYYRKGKAHLHQWKLGKPEWI